MKVTLGEIAKEGIEAHAEGDATTAVQTALQRYADRLGSPEPPVAPPSFLPEREGCGRSASLEFLPDVETRAVLERQARSDSATVEDLAAHAVLLYLAELDAVSAISLDLPPNP